MSKRAWYFGGGVNTRKPAGRAPRVKPEPSECSHPEGRRTFSTGFRTDKDGARFRRTHAECGVCGASWLDREEAFLTPPR